MPDSLEPIILYGHATCPQVPAVRATLKGAGAPYRYVDIRQDEAGREHVRAINGGNESVPTLAFPDGSTLTEPGLGDLQRRLDALGYPVPLATRALTRLPQALMLAVIVWGLLRLLGVL